MLQPAVKVFQSILFLALLCAGTFAHAQADIVSRGIETFRETCLMADPHSERIYQWATDKGLKIVLGQGPERAGPKLLRWEVAKSGDTTVLLQVRVNDPAYLDCSVYFDQQRDSNRLVEKFFAALSPPDVALPRTFATPERSYELFVSACLARFPDIESIGEYVRDLGWRSPAALQTSPFYSGLWNVYDPFDEMSPYGFELKRSNAFRLCSLGFDLRAAVPMDRLIRTYALVHADDPYSTLRRPDEKVECFSGRVAGVQVLFSLRTVPAGHYGDLSVSVETPQ